MAKLRAVETTTAAVAAVQQHELRQMLQLIATTARFPVLTLEGNLNCTPEKRVRFVECWVSKMSTSEGTRRG